VLTSFIALVGMRGPGMEFKEIYDTMVKPWRQDRGKAWGAGLKRLSAAIKVPEVPVRHEALQSYASQLARLVWRFSFAVNKALIAYREPVMEMQLIQERIANAAMELFAVTCVLSRWDSELQSVAGNGKAATTDHVAADLFVRRAFRKIKEALRDLGDNDDAALLATADAVLNKKFQLGANGQ
jgi:acyl-CoA dehydrogenase family member 9